MPGTARSRRPAPSRRSGSPTTGTASAPLARGAGAEHRRGPHRLRHRWRGRELPRDHRRVGLRLGRAHPPAGAGRGRRGRHGRAGGHQPRPGRHPRADRRRGRPLALHRRPRGPDRGGQRRPRWAGHGSRPRGIPGGGAHAAAAGTRRVGPRPQPAPVGRWADARGDAARAGRGRLGLVADHRHPAPGAVLPPPGARPVDGPRGGRLRVAGVDRPQRAGRPADLVVDRPRLRGRQRRHHLRDHCVERIRFRRNGSRHRADAQQLPRRARAQPAGAARPAARHPARVQHGAVGRRGPRRVRRSRSGARVPTGSPRPSCRCSGGTASTARPMQEAIDAPRVHVRILDDGTPRVDHEDDAAISAAVEGLGLPSFSHGADVDVLRRGRRGRRLADGRSTRRRPASRGRHPRRPDVAQARCGTGAGSAWRGSRTATSMRQPMPRLATLMHGQTLGGPSMRPGTTPCHTAPPHQSSRPTGSTPSR